MKTFRIEEEYTALRSYEVKARSEKEARKIYFETSPIQDYEFDGKITNVKEVTNENTNE